MNERDLLDLFGEEALTRASDGDPQAVFSMLTKTKTQGAGAVGNLARVLTDHFVESATPISDDTRAHLIMALAPSGTRAADPADFERLAALVHGTDLMAHLAALDGVLKAHLYPRIFGSEAFEKALARWDDPDWGRTGKMEYARALGTFFRQIAGIPGVSFDTFDEPRGANGTIAMGKCIHRGGGRVSVLLNESEDVAFRGFKDFHETVYHELMHGIHMHFADCVERGDITAIPKPFRTAAVLLSVLCDGRFYAASTATRESYLNHPMEVHAEENAQDFARSLADPARRTDIVEQTRRRLENQGFSRRISSGQQRP